jgi:hypothetical protein
MEVTLMDMEEGVLCLRLQEHQIPYSLAISGVNIDSGDFQRLAMSGVGGVNS